MEFPLSMHSFHLDVPPETIFEGQGLVQENVHTSESSNGIEIYVLNLILPLKPQHLNSGKTFSQMYKLTLHYVELENQIFSAKILNLE